jgi:hypothetical protein
MRRSSGSRSFRLFLAAAACLAASGFATPDARASSSPLGAVLGLAEAVSDLGRATRLVATETSVAYDGVRVPTTMTRGLTGDRHLLFIAFPIDLSLPGLPAPPPQGPALVAIDRVTGQIVGNFPAPPAGFRLPFTPRVVAPGRVVMLDPGGFPLGTGRPDVRLSPILTEYSYTYNPVTRAFSASVVRSTAAPAQLPGSPVPFGFCSDFVSLPDGTIVFAEQVLGALYAWHTDNSLELLVGPTSEDLADAIPEMTSDVFTAGYTFLMPETPRPRPFSFQADYAPGINYLAMRDGSIYWPHELTQSVYRIPVDALFDGREPAERAASIERVWSHPGAVLPPPFGPQFTIIAGITFNPHVPGDHRLYMTGFSEARITRIDTDTVDAPVEEVIADAQLLQGPTNLAFLPPRFGFGPAPLYIVSDQEYELPPLNPLIVVPEFQDWVVTKGFVIH